MEIRAPVAARVSAIPAEVGERLTAGATLMVLEVMKMERPIKADSACVVTAVKTSIGDAVDKDDVLMVVELSAAEQPESAGSTTRDDTALSEVVERHELVLDAARPEAVAKRHDRGHRTVRENLSDLCDEFVEYGPLTVAAQTSRRDLDDLIRNTPADGMVGGVGRIDMGSTGDDRAIVVSYDYTVLAGTQGARNHHKKDRLFSLAAETGWPVVLFGEGGGGRPGDVDWNGVSLLDVRAFRLFAEIPGPTIGVNTGYCFAGNAALIGQCDVIVATTDSNLGMGGPAMIEGGGLGRVDPMEIGPATVQAANGVVDVVVDDDPGAVKLVKQLLSFARGAVIDPGRAGSTDLRRVIPDNRRELYNMREVIDGIVDEDSFLELRQDFAPAAITGFARIDGRPFGIVANDPAHLAGAIDHEAAVTFARHMALCERWGLPILSLADTPGFMVGPDAEAEGLVGSAGDLFRAAAGIDVPFGTVVVRRGFGLGAQAMAAGGFHEPRFTIAWPQAEFGPMGLEGAVKLGFRKELEAIADEEERQVELERRVAEMAHEGRAVNVAMHFEIDDVIDPTDTRRWVSNILFD